MALRQVLGVVGAGVGAFFGGPAGARWGWAIGSAIGNVVDPQVIKGPAIGELAQQTSQEGTPRPIPFGLSPPMAGNIIATGPPRVVKKKKSQGKGGPKVETQTVYRTYAVGVCEGPIFGFVRVWRNGEIVYDAGDVEKYHSLTIQEALLKALRLQANNTKFMEKVTFYLGDYTQNADPALEALSGVGTTPAHRGTVYMVVEDDDLTDMRGAIPQYMFQVATQGALECESAVEYSNEYLPAWPADSISSKDPRDLCGSYTYRKSVSDPFVDTIEEAKAQSVTPLLSPILGWNLRSDTGEGIYPFNSVMTYNAYDYRRFVFFNPRDPSAYSDAEWSTGLFNAFATINQLDGKWWSGRKPGAPSAQIEHAVWHYNGGTSWGNTNDTSVEVLLVPGTPPNPCLPCSGTGYVPSEIPGYCRDAEGNYYSDAPWALDSQTYKVLQLTHLTTAGEGGYYDRRPLSPARPIGHAQYNDQAFWEAAYNLAVTAGDMAPGLIYNTDYPKTQAYGYTRTASTCTLSNMGVDLATLVAAICERAGLTQYDVSQLEGVVEGFAVTNTYPASEALRALGQVYFFDPANYDGRVHFIPRGANTVATISEEELVEDESDIEQQKRGDPIDIPRVLNLNYFDVVGGLATDKQTSERSGDRRSLGEAQLQTPVVMTANTAARAVRINHKVMVEDQRGELKFALPDKYIRLVPSDCIFLQRAGRTDRIRLARVETQDGFQEYIGLRDRQSAYTSSIEGIPASPQQLPPSNVVGPSLLEVLDIHILKDVDDGVGLSYYVAVAGITEAWQGALIELSYDGGANYIESESTELSSTMGELVTALPDHPQAYPDEVNTVQVRILTPNAELLESDLEGMYNGANRAIIGNEIVQFANAVELEPGLWALSLFLRGRKGTFSTTHAAGDRFILLDAFTPIPASVTDIGRAMTFRATSFGLTSDNGTVKTITYAGRSQIERAVAYLEAHRVGANVLVTWQGVGRIGVGVSAQQGARFAGYRVTFSDGVLADVVVDTMAETITQDVSAFGAPLLVTVSQLNDLTGAGPLSEVTLA